MVDEELRGIIELARRGDQDAFAKLVTRFKGHVYRYAAGMLGDRMDAEDAAQEAFTKAYFAMGKLDDAHAFFGWLMQIVTNHCKDKLRQRMKRFETGDMPDETVPDTSAADPAVKMSIEEALGRLSIEHRETVLLHDVQGFRYDEIAKLTGIPIGTVKSRLFTARMSLRKLLDKGEGE
ncbi:RNA polymerase sigma factor [Paenibacillus humicola]|uniref:RNA polymerase sigma factor n=1 Tax=Paenibacillus humicola TaxID=3110540 RepID=UPI00237B311B|nr:RNA polymerase sigma factor [Paenibacillus humicola]